MSWILIIVVIVVVVIVLAILKVNPAGGKGTLGFPYQPADILFTAAERSFLGVLDQAVGSDYRVFGKIRVTDVTKIKPGLSPSARQVAVNRVSQKHFDFVVCRADDLGIVCAVELNDKSHASKKAQARDQFLIKVCKVIALPLLQVPARRSYVTREIRSQFLSAVGTTHADAEAARQPVEIREASASA